jgi:hypothetical protein
VWQAATRRIQDDDRARWGGASLIDVLVNAIISTP